jgi:hypothetical protein
MHLSHQAATVKQGGTIGQDRLGMIILAYMEELPLHPEGLSIVLANNTFNPRKLSQAPPLPYTGTQG